MDEPPIPLAIYVESKPGEALTEHRLGMQHVGYSCPLCGHVELFGQGAYTLEKAAVVQRAASLCCYCGTHKVRLGHDANGRLKRCPSCEEEQRQKQVAKAAERAAKTRAEAVPWDPSMEGLLADLGEHWFREPSDFWEWFDGVNMEGEEVCEAIAWEAVPHAHGLSAEDLIEQFRANDRYEDFEWDLSKEAIAELQAALDAWFFKHEPPITYEGRRAVLLTRGKTCIACGRSGYALVASGSIVDPCRWCDSSGEVSDEVSALQHEIADAGGGWEEFAERMAESGLLFATGRMLIDCRGALGPEDIERALAETKKHAREFKGWGPDDLRLRIVTTNMGRLSAPSGFALAGCEPAEEAVRAAEGLRVDPPSIRPGVFLGDFAAKRPSPSSEIGALEEVPCEPCQGSGRVLVVKKGAFGGITEAIKADASSAKWPLSGNPVASLSDLEAAVPTPPAALFERQIQGTLQVTCPACRNPAVKLYGLCPLCEGRRLIPAEMADIWKKGLKGG